MARVFLINPPSPEPVRTPLLSFGYLAAALERAGHAVGLLDASSVAGPRDAATIAARVADFAPDLVGLHLKTLHAQPAYALARALDGRWPLCAGGPHPTVAPLEPFDHGFRYVARGEGEEILVELCDALDGRRAVGSIAGLGFLDDHGVARLNPPRGMILDLDALASPIPALRLFDPAWYGTKAPTPYGGVLSSRGCPAACTFCSNDVTGRRFRYRDARAVAEEIRELRDSHGAGAFTFFDDSFAVGRRRVEELAETLSAIGRVPWSCTAHPAHLDADTIRLMQRAGCGGIDIGMESADPGRLIAIGKGVTVERVLDVVTFCRDAGVHVVVNLMFGWPDETPAELERTLAFMERAAALGAMFNARGTLVPYPGTEVYERNHRRLGFTRWWIDEAPLEYTTFPSEWSRSEIERAYAADAAVGRNFFRLPREVIALIEEGLRMKARLTFERALPGPTVAQTRFGVAAAGAR